MVLKIQTFGSAKYGAKLWDETKKKWNELGNCTTWYVMEMAEKRAMSRAVLKLTGFMSLVYLVKMNQKILKENNINN